MIKLLEFHSNPFLGLLGFATDGFAAVQKGLPDEILDDVEKVLNVPVLEMEIGGSKLIGALVAANSNGAVVSYIADDEEIEPLRDYVDVLILGDKYNAAGNNILVNDNAALIHPKISKTWMKRIADVLNVPVEKGEIAGIPTVGSAGAVTNEGGLCHPDVDDIELDELSEFFKVPFKRGTANYGSGFVGASIIVNSSGAIIRNRSTNMEISRIEDAFSLL
jgi:translation initiation factor 6